MKCEYSPTISGDSECEYCGLLDCQCNHMHVALFIRLIQHYCESFEMFCTKFILK